ncbi:MAG: hypothetical protein U1D55_14810 [Phycisphaerae bacterium]
MSSDVDLKVCQVCGATVYPEMIQRHTADYLGGKLLCPHCLHEKQAAATPENEPAAADATAAPAESAAKRVYGGGGITFERAGAFNESYKRPLLKNGNATRCRTFHCRLNDTSINHLNQQINEYVDAHEDVEIKFVSTTIGVVEGKHSEQHLFVTIFY